MKNNVQFLFPRKSRMKNNVQFLFPHKSVKALDNVGVPRQLHHCDLVFKRWDISLSANRHTLHRHPPALHGPYIYVPLRRGVAVQVLDA